MSDQPESLSSVLENAIQASKKLQSSPLRQDSQDYQKSLVSCISQFLKIKNQVYHLALFSNNETLEDVNTNYLKFMAVEFHLGELVMKKIDFIDGKALDFDLKVRNLTKSREFFINFLVLSRNYGLLTTQQADKINNFTDLFGPKLEEIRYSDPAMRRAEKIADFKLEKEVNGKIEYIEKRYPDLENADDEVIRELYIAKLGLLILKSFTNLEMITMELQLLSKRPAQMFEIKPEEEKLSDGYTEKLEFETKELISKEGKIMQPFTLVSRDDVKKKVFGYGQHLPTMTVEDYIEEEIKRGGIQMGETQKEESSDSDSDDDEEKLMAKRKWDEFKDDHARGEGNMKGRG